MAIDLGRESIELFFYEAPISKKDKLINDQLQSLVDRLVQGDVSLEYFLEKYALNKDCLLAFPELEIEHELDLHVQISSAEVISSSSSLETRSSLDMYDFLAEQAMPFYEEPTTSAQSYSSSYGVNRYEEVYNESNEISSMDSNPRSLSEAIQSSRVLLYGDSTDLSVQSTRTQETQMTYAEEDTVIASSENTASQQIGIATKRKQLISIGFSNKRPKLPSPDTFESCVVCSSPPVKGKPGKKCTGCNSWIHNKCAKLHAP